MFFHFHVIIIHFNFVQRFNINHSLTILILDLLFWQDVCFQINLILPRLEKLRMFESHMMGQRALWSVAFVTFRHGTMVIPFNLWSITSSTTNIIIVWFHFLLINKKNTFIWLNWSAKLFLYNKILASSSFNIWFCLNSLTYSL